MAKPGEAWRSLAKPLPPSPPEFRAEAIRLARTSGKPPAAIARELGMTGEPRRLWLKPADRDEGKRRDGLTTDEQEELRRLRREPRLWREERELWKPAAAFGARKPKETSSIRSSATRAGTASRPIRRSSGSAQSGASPPAASGPGASAGSRPAPRPMRRLPRRAARSIRRAAARMGDRGSPPHWRRRERGAGAPVSPG